MAADKRSPRRGGGGGFGGRGHPGAQGGPGGGWRSRDTDRQGRGRPPERGGERERGREPPPWTRPEPSRHEARRGGGRWEAVHGDSLEALAAALNSLGVQPEHLVHLVAHVSEEPDGGEPLTEGYEALVWVA
jgi:hypothetical protein